MDLQRIRHLSIIAAEGSLHRAAARIGIDQPALSRKIRELEREIGVDLFSRSSKGMRLTSAGEVLLADLDWLLPQLDCAFDRAKRTAAGAATVVKLALTAFAADSRLTIASIAEARRTWPELEFQLRVRTAKDQFEELRMDQIDLGICNRREPLPEGIASEDLRVDRYQLAVRRGHELTERGRLRLADLQDYDFVFAPQSLWPLVYHECLIACQQGDLTPKIGYEAGSEGMFLNIISEGLAIGFANSALSERPFPDVTYLDIEDLDVQLPLAAIWKRQQENPNVRAFIDLLAKRCADADGNSHR